MKQIRTGACNLPSHFVNHFHRGFPHFPFIEDVNQYKTGRRRFLPCPSSETALYPNGRLIKVQPVTGESNFLSADFEAGFVSPVDSVLIHVCFERFIVPVIEIHDEKGDFSFGNVQGRKIESIYDIIRKVQDNIVHPLYLSLDNLIVQDEFFIARETVKNVIVLPQQVPVLIANLAVNGEFSVSGVAFPHILFPILEEPLSGGGVNVERCVKRLLLFGGESQCYLGLDLVAAVDVRIRVKDFVARYKR